MKPGIHPDYHDITVKMTNGQSFKTKSTWGKEGDSYQLDVDINTHPAWTGGTAQVKNVGKVAEFNKKFGGLTFGATGAKKEEKKDENQAN